MVRADFFDGFNAVTVVVGMHVFLTRLLDFFFYVVLFLDVLLLLSFIVKHLLG